MSDCLIIRRPGQVIEGNATPSDVLSGKTFESTNSDTTQKGAMVNNEAISETILQGGSYTIPEGYHNGSGKVSATANSGNATPSQVLKGYTFYGNGATKQTGAMANVTYTLNGTTLNIVES